VFGGGFKFGINLALMVFSLLYSMIGYWHNITNYVIFTVRQHSLLC